MTTLTDMCEGITELSVADVFTKSDPKYVVPIYQRNYAWGKDEIDQLLDDILTFEENCYYLGNLIVSTKDDTYELIDGQQRLTTLYILCKYLDIYVPSESLTFQIRDASNNTLKNLLELSEKTDLSMEKNYSEEIICGYKIIKEYIERENISEKIKNRLNHVKLLRIEVPDGTDLNHYFEIMNTRGEQLEAQDIIKARMMGVLESDKDKLLFSIIWNACSDMDCYVQMNFDTKTRTSIFGETWNEFKPTTYEDFTNIIINDTDRTRIRSLKDLLGDKSEYNDNAGTKPNDESSESSSSSITFKSIIEFPYFLIHINMLVRGINVSLDDKDLLGMYKSDYYRNPENIRSFIFHLLKYRFLFDKFIIKRDYEKEKTDGDWSLKKISQRDKNPYYKGTFGDEKDGDSYINRKLRTLQSALRITYTSPKAMAWITEFLRDDTLLSDINGKSFLDKIEHYCRQKVKDALEKYNKTKNAYQDMERIVYTYLDYILWRDGYNDIIKPNSDWKFLFRNSLEHFSPQTPDKNEEHKRLDDTLLHNFGNLCLVDVSANAKFSNLEPAAKIIHCENTIEQSLKLKIMAKIAQAAGWNSSTIIGHGEKMLELLRKDIGNAP